MMNKPVRIGVIGCGSVMSKYMQMAEQLRHSGLAEVVVACDVAQARCQHMRDRYGLQRVTANYHEVVGMADVDLVLVLTSMQEHYEIARAALEAGKHVLVEKPMATTLAEAAQLVEMAKVGPGLLHPAPHIILSDTYQTIWKRVHRGDIGKVLTARALYGWAGPSWGKWFYRQGGGALFDLGVYNVTSLTGLLGPAKRVTAMAGVVLPDRLVEGAPMDIEAEDTAHVLIDFGEARFAVVSTGFTMQQYRCPAIELYGTHGTLQMMGDDWDPEGYELWQNDVGAWQIFGETNPAWPWVDGLRHLVESIRDKTKPIITPEHGYHVLEIMIKAQAAAKDGQAKTIESTFAPLNFFDKAEREALAAHLVHDPTR